ncbi:LIM domain-containing protein unc-97 [Fragariocoptes setiger]|uniref:LIM domain-containing protein unc-97 n=1 Tax=Fragariocoptes setiger TaxID=1670756 RepID=A0ABQ7S9L8_9ACAR|nr:LIM domain-containing protein unc-97 [Fragariocoptes setiger]
MDISKCAKCNDGFEPYENIAKTGPDELWHIDCFVCSRCFQPFKDNEYFEFEGRKYCHDDFKRLYAPCCSKCGTFIIGRVIRAMHRSWHPDCFECQICGQRLTDFGFISNAGRALCYGCDANEYLTPSLKCHKCRQSFDDESPLRYQGECYHPYHFNCFSCGSELSYDSREVNGKLLCIRCHDKSGLPICGACHKPIEERVVTALGKQWHVEHFACAQCERPFLGKRHYEKRGLAYCEQDYKELFGSHCHVCDAIIEGDVVSALGKTWCVDHFSCSFCNTAMNHTSKFYDVESRPCCKKCFDMLPSKSKKQIYKEIRAKKKAMANK